MGTTHDNWIGGEWKPSSAEATFEVWTPTGPARRLGRWPRSGEEDLSEALAAARRSLGGWSRMPARERREILLDALSEDLFLGDPDGLLAARLGLQAEEVVPLVEDARRAGRAVLANGRRRKGSRRGKRAGVCVMRVHGAALFDGLITRLWPRLAAGSVVCLVTDGRLPMIAEELCLALDHAGLPEGVVALLGGDGDTLVRAALARSDVSRVELVDREDRASEFEDREVGGGSRLRLRPLRGRSLPVGGNIDPALEAERIVDAAFGRVRALSGQREGQVSRVVCDQRVFSALTAALLEEIDRLLEEGPDPLPALEPDLPHYVARLRRLGLDEGATLLRGDEPGSPLRGRGARLLPLVFTNVEPGMRLARAARPAPVLALMRALDEDDAREIAGHLDRPEDA